MREQHDDRQNNMQTDEPTDEDDDSETIWKQTTIFKLNIDNYKTPTFSKIRLISLIAFISLYFNHF